MRCAGKCHPRNKKNPENKKEKGKKRNENSRSRAKSNRKSDGDGHEGLAIEMMTAGDLQ